MACRETQRRRALGIRAPLSSFSSCGAIFLYGTEIFLVSRVCVAVSNLKSRYEPQRYEIALCTVRTVRGGTRGTCSVIDEVNSCDQSKDRAIS